MLIEVEFKMIHDGGCMCCKKTTAAFNTIKQIEFYHLDMQNKKVKIGYDDVEISEDTVIELFKQKGYKIEKVLQ